jgi:hypothetical protein
MKRLIAVAAGYAKAYKEAGYRCNSKNRLERR